MVQPIELPMTTANDLITFVKKTLKGKKFIVAVQSEPYQHVRTADGIEMQKQAGGAHVLLDAILSQIGGTIVALSRGNADAQVVDEHGSVEIPSVPKSYKLKRIFLKKKEMDGFYYGFANQTLWPLCHGVFIKPIFNHSWWEEYVSVNKKFAESILEELNGEDGFIWINDYHLALLPKMLHEQNPKLAIGTFWHIPWPTQEIFRICPWRKDLLEGLLGSDFIGFHRDYHVENFIDSVKREIGAIIESEPETVIYRDHETKLVNLPAGIDYDEIREALSKKKDISKTLIKHDFGIDTEYLAIGVERVDYIKGLIERIKIIDRFLEKYPQYQGKFTYLSIAPPSRLKIPAYKTFNRELYDLIEKVNWKYSTIDWQPVYFIDETVPREKIFSYFNAADIGLVTSLDDGMNLVAKEYVIACKPNKGMLILSKFIGAAKDLKAAVLINPYDIEGSADALYKALTMPEEEKEKRNAEMKQILKENNIYKWGIKFIRNTLRFNEDAK